ncbi:MAG: chromate transporter, partial [Synechococcaceae bacterium WB9_2_170]|nr:chromate transporter [Synechococcaceae bacterium WB9_2_170]
MSGLDTFLQVIWTFLRLSLFSLGGGNTLLQEYHHLAVNHFHWITDSQFADLYALAEAAPVPRPQSGPWGQPAPKPSKPTIIELGPGAASA